MSDSPFYNKTEVKYRGWTDTAITKFLGKPDRTGKNRYNRRGKVLLYLKDRVHDVEATDRFRDWKQASAARRASATTAAAKKRAATLEKVSSRLDSIDLADGYKGLTRSQLRDAASESFLALEARRAERSGGFYEPEIITSRRTDPFFDRIETNYLRHEGTVYDSELDEYFNATGVGQAIDMIRERIYSRIAYYYPHLANECDRQLAQRRAKEAYKRRQDVTNRSATVKKAVR